MRQTESQKRYHDRNRVKINIYCNVALGYLREDINTMKKMIDYVERHNQ